MSNKINVTNIIRAHLKTLYNNKLYKTDDDVKKLDKHDVFWFYVFPLLLVVLFIFIDLNHKLITNSISISLSIFIGLLLNLLVLISTQLKKETKASLKKVNPDLTNRDLEFRLKKNVLIQELYNNISYSIIISVVSLVIVFLGIILKGICIPYFGIDASHIPNFIAYYLYINLLLTLFMILKRTYLILESEFS